MLWIFLFQLFYWELDEFSNQKSHILQIAFQILFATLFLIIYPLIFSVPSFWTVIIQTLSVLNWPICHFICCFPLISSRLPRLYLNYISWIAFSSIIIKIRDIEHFYLFLYFWIFLFLFFYYFCTKNRTDR